MPKAVKTKTPTCGSSHGPATASQGFTLLELLVVLLLLLAGAALVPPFLSKGLSSAEFKQSVRLVAAGLRKTHTLALSGGSEQRFLIDLEARSFTVGDSGMVSRLPGQVDLKLETAASEQTGDSAGAIRFFPDGSSTGGTVTLSSGSRSMRVAVNWMTGKVVTEAVR